MSAELLTALRDARKSQDAAAAVAVLRAIAPADRDPLLQSLPPSLQAWVKALPADPAPPPERTPCDATPEEEQADLVSIVLDAHRQDERQQVLELLRAIAWVSPEAKASFWRSLPTAVQDWLTAAPPAAVPDRAGLSLELETAWGLTPTVRAIARGVVLAADGATDEELEQKLRAAGIACPLEWLPTFAAWLRETG